jgi:hypothetical protein
MRIIAQSILVLIALFVFRFLNVMKYPANGEATHTEKRNISTPDRWLCAALKMQYREKASERKTIDHAITEEIEI